MITKIKTQVLILGSGPGGYSAAFNCSNLGINTIIVERYSHLGGVCLNVGCIPSKTLLHIAKLITANNDLNQYNIDTKKNNIELDINKICLWKNNIIDRLSNNLHSMAKNRNIQIIHGSGKFIDAYTIQVLMHNEIIAEIIFDYVIIATGSYPISLPSIPNDRRIWSSTDALSLKSIPKKLLIIGSGAIGLEMATVYHALGSKVDLLETYNQIMPILDPDLMYLFSKKLHQKNIKCFINTNVQSIHTEKEGIYVIMVENNQNSSKKLTQLYDSILIAIGRSPNNKELNLEQIGIKINQNGFINVDKQMRTNIPHIFAIGDVVGNPMLAHKSMHEGYIASEVIAGKKNYFDSKVIPSVVYTDPEIAWAGYTEKQAQEKNINYERVILPWTNLGKAIVSNNTTGITKLIFDKKTNRIIGGLILGTNASEIIGEIALAIEMGCDVEDLKLTIHAHPTLYESIQVAAAMYYKSINN